MATKRKNKRRIIVFGMIFVVILVLVLIRGVIHTEKTPFGSVSLPRRTLMLCFDDVLLKRSRMDPIITYVLVRKRGVMETRIDSELSSNLLSVTPSFSSRVLYSVGFLDFFEAPVTAKKVIIWVNNEKEKNLWDEWVRKSEECRFSSLPLPEPKTIIPPK